MSNAFFQVFFVTLYITLDLFLIVCNTIVKFLLVFFKTVNINVKYVFMFKIRSGKHNVYLGNGLEFYELMNKLKFFLFFVITKQYECVSHKFVNTTKHKFVLKVCLNFK